MMNLATIEAGDKIEVRNGKTVKVVLLNPSSDLIGKTLAII